MIDFNADIISFTSLANIRLGHSVDMYLEEMLTRFTVETKKYPSSSPLGGDMHGYFLDDNTISIFTDANDIIVSVVCNQNYHGRYQNKLYAGITMERLTLLSKSILLINGALIVDGDYGLAFSLPSPYDEIADSLQHIPGDLQLVEVVVSDHSSWAPQASRKGRKKR